MLKISKLNESYIHIDCSEDIAFELRDHFTYKMPGYQFTPAFKHKMWNGNVYLFNPKTCLLYAGLLKYVENYAEQRGYPVELLSDFSSSELSLNEATKFLKTLNLTIEPRPFQIESFVKCVRDHRTLLLSPTASGKSLIIYMLYRYYNKKTLIIVPTTGLIAQMMSDFISYGYEDTDQIKTIYAGQTKTGPQQLFISTWQSIYEQPKKWFEQFEVIIGDEAHNFKAKSLTSIMLKSEHCKYRFGTTGTIAEDSKVHKLVLEGLFGPVRQIITTRELIDQNYATEVLIKNILLSYPDEVRKQVSKFNYAQEIDYICGLNKRNRFILNTALSLGGNTLILFRYVEKHGKVLYEQLKAMNPDIPVYFISGETDTLEREDIRTKINNSTRSIIIASEGTTSTGINMPTLSNIILASPSKGKIKLLQAIGRILRLSKQKDLAVVIDIADDFSWKNKRNTTLVHLLERIKIYHKEQFNYKLYRVSIGI